MVSIKKSSKLPSVFYVFFQLGLDKDEVFPIFKKSTFLILIQKKTYKIKLNIYFFVSNTFWLDYNWQIFLDFVLCSTLESWFPMIFYMMFHLKFDFIVSYATPMSWNFRKKKIILIFTHQIEYCNIVQIDIPNVWNILWFRAMK